MKRISLFILAITALLFACQKNMDQTVQKNGNTALQKAMLDQRSVALQQNKVVITQQNNPNQVTKEWSSKATVHASIVDNLCGTDIDAVVVEGPIQGLHIGLSALRISFCIGVSPFYEGSITAANGDEIHILEVAEGTQQSGLPYQDYIITGGTGRFAGASGSFRNNFSTFDNDNNIYIAEQTGTINY
jgi:hypothetical protein